MDLSFIELFVIILPLILNKGRRISENIIFAIIFFQMFMRVALSSLTDLTNFAKY